MSDATNERAKNCIQSTSLLSVVIATRNASGLLADCLVSLAGQSFRDFEVLIQDGASTDGTPDLARSFSAVLPNLVVHSEPDSGIYDAWNKALPHVRGQWVLFLGSDDTLAGPDVLARCAAVLEELPEDVLYGCGGALEIFPDGSMKRASACRAEGAIDRLDVHIPFCHSSLWHRASLFCDIRFDTALRIAADYQFIFETWRHDGVGQTLDFVVTHMRVGGISSHPRHKLRALWENLLVSARHGRPVLTRSRLVPLAKATLLWGVCLLAGRRAPAILDRLRALRGLPPCWQTADPLKKERDT
ncbi:glycosyltransferase family 2 protein [Nitratidesulfovibrio sp. D1]|uniref:glycosyltransferase family 2 protein n=1 Tax=Nitratidesulfovibrio sp. D1 TaxID=3440151 RepID=UPI003EC00FD7